MAKRRKSGITGLLKNKYIMWGLYGAVAYYAYGWWFGQQQTDTNQPVVIPEPQVSAFPTSYLP